MLSFSGRFWLLVVFIFAAIGCNPAGTTSPGDKRETVLSRILAEAVSPDARVRADILLEPARVSLSDKVQFSIRIRHEKSLEIVPLEFGKAFGDFDIAEIEQSSEVTDEGRILEQYVLTLVPKMTGEQNFLPIPIYYHLSVPPDKADSPAPEMQSLAIFPPAITVGSEIPEDEANLESIKPNTELIPFREPLNVFLLAGAGFAVALTVFIMGLIARFRKEKRLQRIVRYTPKEVALLRLDELMQSRLDESDIKLFYEKLSDIVRWYIEETTEYHARELTTEEFLREISRPSTRTWSFGPNAEPSSAGESAANSFSVQMQKRLADFLEASDLVKFAKFRPPHEQIAESFLMARELVEA